MRSAPPVRRTLGEAGSPKSRVPNPESVWFGHTQVKPEEKTERVQHVFDSVANRYDLMNDLMSAGLHRLWKNRLVAMMRPRPGQKILDVAGGTGDIALRCAERTNGKAHVVVCDLNPAMLTIGRAKAIDHGWLPSLNHPPLAGSNPKGFDASSNALFLRRRSKSLCDFGGGSKNQTLCASSITWITGNAEALPFPDQSFDTVAIAFGLRNITHIDTALTEFARVLKPGGRFFCLEFSPGVAPWLKGLYSLYSENVLPWLGQHVAEDRDSYSYLVESIERFPPQDVLASRMKNSGFVNVTWANLMGGIAVIHSCWRN
jgi:demethylmenaquinone methyltransferase / 2-methoxy-6-polyprenyl-1,4-benzoquinol methylase